MNPFFSPVQYTKEHEGSHETDGGRTWNTEREVRAREMMTIHLQVPSIVSLSSWIPFPLLSISCSVILVPTSKCTQIMRHGREKKERRRREGGRDQETKNFLMHLQVYLDGLSLFLSPIPDLYPFPWYLLCLRCLSQSIFTSLLFLDSLPFFEDVVFIVFWTFFLMWVCVFLQRVYILLKIEHFPSRLSRGERNRQTEIELICCWKRRDKIEIFFSLLLSCKITHNEVTPVMNERVCDCVFGGQGTDGRDWDRVSKALRKTMIYTFM